MRQNHLHNNGRTIVALASLVVFAFVFLAVLLAPNVAPPELTLVVLATLLRLIREIVSA